MLKNFRTAWALPVLVTAVLLGCGKSEPRTGASVIAKMEKAGIAVGDVTMPPREPKSPLPQSFDEHVVFSLAEIAPKGGQMFLCSRKEYCDAMFQYFDVLRVLAGPYIFRSKDGLVVFQLNSGLTPATADKIRAVIDEL